MSTPIGGISTKVNDNGPNQTSKNDHGPICGQPGDLKGSNPSNPVCSTEKATQVWGQQNNKD